MAYKKLYYDYGYYDYGYDDKEEYFIREMQKAMLKELRGGEVKKEEVKSISSINDKIITQYNDFIDSINKNKIPLKIIKTDGVIKNGEDELNVNSVCIHIKKDTLKYNKYLDDNYYMDYLDTSPSEVELILTPEEIAAGVIHHPHRKDLVLLGFAQPGINISDEHGNPKFRAFIGENGPETIRVHGLTTVVYEPNPDYAGAIKYKEVFKPNKNIYVPAIFKDIESRKWTIGKLDINNLSPNTKNNILGVSKLKNIKLLSFVRVINCTQSSSLFGYSGIKKEMFESKQLFNIAEILIDFKCKKDGNIRDVVEVCYKGKTYKFLGEDLEFVYPDIEQLTKGYSLPKDRTIRTGITAKVIKDKGTKLRKNDQVTICKKVSTFYNKDYFEVEKDNKKYIINKNQLKVV